MFRKHLILSRALVFVAISMVSAALASTVLPRATMLMPIATVIIFLAAPFVGVLSFRYGEPRALRNMLARATVSSRVHGGVVLASSLRRLSALDRANPPEGSETFAQRVSRSDTGVMAASRLIAVRVNEGIELRTGREANRVVATIPRERYSLEAGPVGAVLRIRGCDGADLVSFPVVSAASTTLVPLELAEAQRALGTPHTPHS